MGRHRILDAPEGNRAITGVFLGALCLLCIGHAWQTRFVCDDAAILWRYSKHFAEGHGFRYNIGDDPVDGTSSIPFAAVMSLGFSLGIDPEAFTYGLGLLLAPLATLLAYVLARRVGLSPWLALVACLALTVNHSFSAWSTGGLGTKVTTVLLSLALIRFLDEEAHRERSPLVSSTLFGLVAILRPEGLVFFGLAMLWRLATRRPWPRIALFTAPFALLKGGQLAFNLAYFGSIVPNTAYAKLNGIWFERGFWYLGEFFWTYSLWLLLPLCFIACVIPLRPSAPLRWLESLRPVFLPPRSPLRERRAAELDPMSMRFLCLIILGYALSLAAIGGDRFEFRMLDPILPPLYVTAVGGAWSLARRLPKESAIAVPASLLLALLVPASSLAGTWLRKPEGYIGGQDKLMTPELLGRNFAIFKADGLVLKKHFPPDARILQATAGAIPLYSELYTLDAHGLNDPVIARRPIAQRGIYSHEKAATREDMDRARVDYVQIRIHRRNPFPELGFVLGLPPQVVLEFDPSSDEVPAPLAPLLRRHDALCVKLEDSVYLVAVTRLEAEKYRREWKERGYKVLF